MSAQKKVSVNILLYNSRKYLPHCLEAISSQTYQNLEVTIIDNASTDGGADWVREHYPQVRLIVNAENKGFCGGHNQGIRATDGPYVLLLNPDVSLTENYVEELVSSLEKDDRIGAAMGKLYLCPSESLRCDHNVIDSVGVMVCKNRRTLDRGHGQPDDGQYAEESFCFGPNGAVPLYKREMLEDLAIEGEYLDEDFFAYREEVDLAWRAQLLGWKAVFNPRAIGFHDRTYMPATRRQMPRFRREHMFKNRYLLVLKNDLPTHFLRHLPHILWFEFMLWGYTLLFEPYLLKSAWRALKLTPRMLRKRALIMERKVVPDDYIYRWFV